MPSRMLKVLLACLLLGSVAAHGQVVFANPPLPGVEGRDYWIVNYVDHDTSSPGILNYECGDKTYNGHQGTDFLLRSFKTMDSGVFVQAVAPGRVFTITDGLFDRNKHTNPGGFGNYVGINHQGLYYTYYAHLMNGSVLVHVGDSVVAGQHLGKVACSGNCTDPHVHLEVWDNVVNVDPFTGPCQATPGLWAAQPFYDTSRLIIDVGFTPYVPNLDTLKERYLVRDTFYAGVDTAVNYWTQMQGVRAGDTQRVDWYTPSGVFWYTYSYVTPSDWWYDYFWTYITMPTIPGTWHADYYVNSAWVSSNPFYVVGAPVTRVEVLGSGPANFTIGPNPSKNEIHINGNLPPGEPLVLANAEGRVVKYFSAQSRVLSIGDIPAGIYLLRCGTVVKKVIKE